MTSPLIAALREARTVLGAAEAADAREATLAKRVIGDLDDAIALLAGGDVQKDLVSIVCHDLKDPLASIVMGAGFLKKTMPAEEGATRRIVDAIVRSADRMSQVVSDFHDLAKLERGLLTIDAHPCDVVAALRGAIGALATAASDKGVSLTFESSAERAVAVCDRARVLQIVSKVVANALKFTEAKGSVVVRVGSEDTAPVVSVWVRDTGRGIAAERLPHIFDHAANARRTPRDGPGLGLPIARGLAELQGGRLTVESRLGEGSTFELTLPRG